MSEVVGGGSVPGTESVFGRRGTTLKKQVFSVGILAVVALIAFFGYRVWQGVQDRSALTVAAPVEVVDADVVLSVTPETSVSVVQESDATYESEHFRVGEIAIGGELALIVPESDPHSLEIRSVRGEAFSEKESESTKLVLTWETSKPAVSDIAYGRGIGQAEAVVRETSYGTNHSVLISGLAPATTYVYVITARDKWGGEISSDPYAVYTGSRQVSLFELIAGAVGDVFGWTVD